MIGGDNASRSIAVGMVLGAIVGEREVFGGSNEFGNKWKNSLNAYSQLEEWINKLNLIKGDSNELKNDL